MKPKTMILLVVAVGCGLGASYMTSKLLADRNKGAVPTVPVLVAKARIPAWQPIKEPENLFEIKHFNIDVAPVDPFDNPEELKDKQFNKVIEPGKPVTKSDLLTDAQKEIAHQIQPGQRAVSIKVNAESSISGFALPGKRVDVMVTIRGNEASSRIFLQNMLVLAVDTNDQRNPDVKAVVGQTVTLAATPEEASRLSLAQSAGELRLLLKRPGDMTSIKPMVVKLSDLDKPLKESVGKVEPESDSTPPSAAGLDFPKELPPVEAAPPKPEEPKKVEEPKKPEPAVRPERRRTRKKTHVMQINSGAEQRKVRFRLGEKRDDDEDEEDEDASARSDSESKKDRVAPRAEPAKKEPAKTEPAQPAPTPPPTIGRRTRVPGRG